MAAAFGTGDARPVLVLGGVCSADGDPGAQHGGVSTDHGLSDTAGGGNIPYAAYRSLSTEPSGSGDNRGGAGGAGRGAL